MNRGLIFFVEVGGGNSFFAVLRPRFQFYPLGNKDVVATQSLLGYSLYVFQEASEL